MKTADEVKLFMQKAEDHLHAYQKKMDVHIKRMQADAMISLMDQKFTTFSSIMALSIDWKCKRALLPHYCWKSSKVIWPLSKAYIGVKYLDEPAPVNTKRVRWLSKEQFTFLRLQGKV